MLPFVIAGGGLAATFLFAGGGKYIAETARDMTTRGEKINFVDVDPILGVVLEDPERMRAAASVRVGFEVTRDQLALSRMIRSEGSAQGLLRAHIALNDLASFRYADDLFELLTYSTDPKRRGLYGVQYSGPVPPNYPQANARRYATSKNSYMGDLQTAMTAIEERDAGYDRADGAVKFIDRASMGVQLGSKPFAVIDASWRSEGLQPFTMAEYGDDLVLYRRG